jgi:hypothetical protein
MSNMNDLLEMTKRISAPQPRFQVFEATDLRMRIRTYKIYRRGTAGLKPPIVIGIATFAEAQAKANELDAAEKGNR